MKINFEKDAREAQQLCDVPSGACFKFLNLGERYKDDFYPDLVFIKCDNQMVVELECGATFKNLEADRPVKILDAEIIIHN